MYYILVLVDSNFGEMRRNETIASDLHKNNSFAHILLPVGPGSYIPERPKITEMLRNYGSLKNVYNTNKEDGSSKSKDLLPSWNFSSIHTTKAPLSPESITKLNLRNILHLICEEANKYCKKKDNFSVIEEQLAGDELCQVFVKRTSKPEMAVKYMDNRESVVLIASEAKDLTSCVMKSYPQAISFSCDLALALFESLSTQPTSSSSSSFDFLSYVDVVVPFVVVASDKVQFGVTYLIPLVILTLQFYQKH